MPWRSRKAHPRGGGKRSPHIKRASPPSVRPAAGITPRPYRSSSHERCPWISRMKEHQRHRRSVGVDAVGHRETIWPGGCVSSIPCMRGMRAVVLPCRTVRERHPTAAFPSPVRFLNTNDLPPPNGYSHVVEVVSAWVVHVSGQEPLDAGGVLVGAGDVSMPTKGDVRAMARATPRRLRTGSRSRG